jgi:hypothetical protein
MSFFAAGGGLAVVAGLGLRYIESRYGMSDIQDGSPSSSEPLVLNQPTDQQGGAGGAGNDAGGASLGEQSPGATSAPVAQDSDNAGDSGNGNGTSLSDSTGSKDSGNGDGSTGTDAQGDGVAAAGEPGAGTADGAADTSSVSVDASASPLNAGEPLAEEQKDSGTLSPSNSTVAPVSGADAGNGGTGASGSLAPVDSSSDLPTSSAANAVNSGSQLVGAEDSDAGNDAGQADSASGAISIGDAPLSPVTALAVATFVDLLENVETRQYPDGVILKSSGVLPAESPVSYPAPQAPEADTAHGLLNAIEEYFTTALRSSRTDGHKLIAQLRGKLPQQQ